MPGVRTNAPNTTPGFATNNPIYTGMVSQGWHQGEFPLFGRGIDGDLTLAASYNINTQTNGSSISLGQAYMYGSAGQFLNAAGANANYVGYYLAGSSWLTAGTHVAAYQPATSVTLTISSGSNTGTVSSAAGLYVGQIVSGTGMPSPQYISGISGTTITLYANATTSGARTVTAAAGYVLSTGPVGWPGSLTTVTQWYRQVDSPVLQVTGIDATGKVLSVNQASTALGSLYDIKVGDLVLVANLQGQPSFMGNVGNYELVQVAAVGSTTLTLNSALTKGYGPAGTLNTTFTAQGSTTSGSTTVTLPSATISQLPASGSFAVTGTGIPANAMATVATSTTITLSANATATNASVTVTFLGVQSSSQKVVVQRVPEYGVVTINSGGVLTASAWNGTAGGVVAALANTLTCSGTGTVSASGLGYRNSTPALFPGGAAGYPGEGAAGLAAAAGTSGAPTGTGGGGGGTGIAGTAGSNGAAFPAATNQSGAGGGGGGGGGSAGGGARYAGGTTGNPGAGGGGGGAAAFPSQVGNPAGNGANVLAPAPLSQGGAGGTAGAPAPSTGGSGGNGGAAGGGGSGAVLGLSDTSVSRLIFGGAGGTAGAGASGGNGGTTPSTPAPAAGLGGGGGGGGGYTIGAFGAHAANSPLAPPAATPAAANAWSSTASGDGGAGGGVVFVAARNLTLAATAKGNGGVAGASGSQGGQGGTTPAPAATLAGGGGSGGAGGGGGGGAGGSIVAIAYAFNTPASPLSAAGGTGGTGGSFTTASVSVPGQYWGGAGGSAPLYGGAGESGHVKVIYFTAPTGLAGATSDGPAPAWAPPSGGYGWKQSL